MTPMVIWQFSVLFVAGAARTACPNNGSLRLRLFWGFGWRLVFLLGFRVRFFGRFSRFAEFHRTTKESREQSTAHKCIAQERPWRGPAGNARGHCLNPAGERF